MGSSTIKFIYSLHFFFIIVIYFIFVIWIVSQVKSLSHWSYVNIILYLLYHSPCLNIEITIPLQPLSFQL